MRRGLAIYLIWARRAVTKQSCHSTVIRGSGRRNARDLAVPFEAFRRICVTIVLASRQRDRRGQAGCMRVHEVKGWAEGWGRLANVSCVFTPETLG